MSTTPPNGPRRIIVSGPGPTPSPGASVPVAPPATSAAPPVIPPPPWARDAAPVAVPDRLAAARVDLAELAARIDANTARLREDATRFGARLALLEGGFAPARERAFAASGDVARTAVERIRGLDGSRRADAERAIEDEAASAMGELAALVAELAPGGAGADWRTASAEELLANRIPADHARFGTAATPSGAVPALARIGPGHGWIFSGDPEPARDLLFGTVLRIVAQSPLTHLAIESYDPGMTARLAPLAALRALQRTAFPASLTQRAALQARLEEIVVSASETAERVVMGGARSLTELWAAAGAPEGMLNVVVVLDYPRGIDRQIQAALERLAAFGAAAGVLLLVHEDPTARPEDGVDPTALRARLSSIETTGGRVRVAELPSEIEVEADAAPDAAAIDRLVAGVRARLADDRGPVVPLDELIAADIAAPWTHSSADGVEALVGRAGRELLGVSLRTENPPHPNLLIGGAVGTGKSNLLLDLVYSSATVHGPEELELILLDFKRGLEFKRFDADENGEGWLPHVSVLSLESSQEFGVAVLQHVSDEMERRSELFKSCGAASIDAYRRASGAVLPRLMLVIDEFHVLFDGEERLTETAVSLLETIAKQGRAYGIHLVLASQTVSGISGLRSKGQSIFAQFPLRISLKNTPDESQAVLAAHNTAAAELSHRGEVIVNRNFGHVASNERGLAAYVDSARFARLQRELWQRGHGRAPLVFMGREPAAWDEQALDALRPPTDREAPLQLWVGRPIQITDEPERIAIRRDVDQAVAIVGADHESDPVMPGLVGSMIVSAAGQLQAGDVVVVLDGTGERAPEWLAPVEDRLRRLGVSLRHVPASGAAAVLRDELGRRPRDGFDTVLVVALAVQRIPGMDETAPSSDAAPDPLGGFGALSLGGSLAGASGDAAPTTARAALQLLAREGALRGTPLIASWANVAALNASLGLSHAGVGSYLTVSLGREDLKVVANTHDPRIAGHPRVGYVDRNSTRGLRTVVPFARWGGARRHGEAE